VFDYDAWLEAPYTDAESECDNCEDCEDGCSDHEEDDAYEAYQEHLSDVARGK
jgi:hypothetical protein